MHPILLALYSNKAGGNCLTYVGTEGIGKFFVKRLNTVFAKVASNPLFMCNSKGVPLFLLCFAAGNPKHARLAVKIAKDILR